MAEISLRDVTKRFGDVTAVDRFSAEVADGEFLVLVGPSGCGKSTLLRMIAGLEEISDGEVAIGGRVVNDMPPKKRDVAMVFQSYALYPHLDVAGNMGFALRMRRRPRAEIRSRVGDAARLLRLDSLLGRRPFAISGGQRQRVAMGRAMVREPRAFLMDEPLSNLDAKLRVQMRAELQRLRKRLATTTVYVTHDQVEAMTLGDRVAVMRDGVLQQLGRPQDVFRAPANLFVAAFIGSPSMNLVEARAEEGAVAFGSHRLPVPADRLPAGVAGRRVVVGIRPTALLDARRGAGRGLPVIGGEVELVEDLGSHANVIFAVDAPPFDSEQVRAAADTEDAELGADGARNRFVASVDRAGGARAGAAVRFAVDVSELHLFDPDTGRALTADPLVHAA